MSNNLKKDFGFNYLLMFSLVTQAAGFMAFLYVPVVCRHLSQ